MKKVLLLLVSITLVFAVNACKNDVKQSDAAETVAEETTFPKESRELTQEEKTVQSSVLAKAMTTPELSSFVSFLISTELSDVLTKEEGTYTLLAPSTTAFKAKDNMLRTYQHVDKRDTLKQIIGSHIIEGNLDSIAMVTNIRTGNGTYTMTTYSGETLTLKRKGLEIIVKDAYGNEATIGKSDITGANGVVHVIDNVLGFN